MYICSKTRYEYQTQPTIVQIPGEVFVFGDGDCGQLGLGEDVTERLRPFPVDIDGKKVHIQSVCCRDLTLLA